ncbi:MAG: 3,4-dihydroxy-2-butanone-4-phosphate synthase, partial [Candidatus Nanohaloarchaea archaeon]
WQDIADLRTEAGGMVCVAISHRAAETYDLPFRRDLLDRFDDEAPYGDRSSFSLAVNHAATYTGVTDRDRATTVTALARGVPARRPLAPRQSRLGHPPAGRGRAAGADAAPAGGGHGGDA